MKLQKDKVTPKPSVSSKIYKKKHGHNTKTTWGLASCITIEKLDNLNEVIREHKTQRAEGKGTWKLVPKDSCEVYKERRKRKMESEKRIEDNARENEYDTRTTGRRIVRRRQINRRNRRKYTRPYIKRTNRKRIQPSESSITSGDCDCDCGCNCGSPSSTASSARSSVTISDMEYD